jgi:hypothetical protein
LRTIRIRANALQRTKAAANHFWRVVGAPWPPPSPLLPPSKEQTSEMTSCDFVCFSKKNGTRPVNQSRKVNTIWLLCILGKSLHGQLRKKFKKLHDAGAVESIFKTQKHFKSDLHTAGAGPS